MLPRETFDKELRHLQDEILRMGSEVEENLVKVVEALVNRDLELSKQMVKADEWFNQRRIDIGMEAFSVIATQQPIAGDMRLIAAVLEIVGELERIHDYVKGIGNISLSIGEEAIPPKLASHLPEMAEKAGQMLHQSLDAFIQRDASMARQVAIQDDAVDRLYNKVYKATVRYIYENQEAFEKAQKLEWAAHNLERSADRVTNICEWINYMATGKFQQGKVFQKAARAKT